MTTLRETDNKPVAWALWMPGESTPRLVHVSEEASKGAGSRWPVAYKGCRHVPLYARQQSKKQPLTDEQIHTIADGFSNEFGLEAKHIEDFVRAIEYAHGITK